MEERIFDRWKYLKTKRSAKKVRGIRVEPTFIHERRVLADVLTKCFRNLVSKLSVCRHLAILETRGRGKNREGNGI